MHTPGNFLYRVMMEMSRCANVPSLVSLAQKLTNSEDHGLKVFPLWHVLLVLLITVYPNRFCPPVVAVDPQRLRRIRPLVWPVTLEK